MLLIRVVTMLLGLLLGFLAGRGLATTQTEELGMVNTLSLMLAGMLTALLLAPRVENVGQRAAARFTRWYARLSPRSVAAATFGLIVALLVSVLLSSLLRTVPFYTWIWNLVVTAVLGVFFVSFALRNAESFGLLAFPQVRRKPGSKLLDSNVIIDGRIVELLRSGFLEGELVVPAFILRELQTLSDHHDAQKRTRGKRGLAVLEDLRALRPLRIEDWDDPALPTTDDKLIRLARESGARIVTNDSNLGKIARLHGVEILSIHEAAVALKPQVQAGDHLTVTISKGGQQKNQGVGYLDDGTMVVVEDAIKFRGKPTRVVVVNNVQTNVGRMIFAKLESEEGAA
ncbi:PIN/TRAM domain-containing protein [Deinococcus arenae]|uniref:PIN/TRAM domain-containing protein n=1 Tax=Deinococcus arenae TaxID=1452751 RepID=A0A8H9LBM5_9DEIO|nr:PIN/TRAM domain-containing protein [Deinococcus arenae]AWT35008.1 twitching motility protein PilT [Deinococcus actinosclerus]GGM46138.1 PIN/TRAM domain-containing protein [Deinococcus arenae]